MTQPSDATMRLRRFSVINELLYCYSVSKIYFLNINNAEYIIDLSRSLIKKIQTIWSLLGLNDARISW